MTTRGPELKTDFLDAPVIGEDHRLGFATHRGVEALRAFEDGDGAGYANLRECGRLAAGLNGTQLLGKQVVVTHVPKAACH
jgi:hypothetical protein